ncbi:unnamed protein product [Discula destructiva]
MDFAAKSRNHPPRLKQNRIILHFDYDCFYAQVVENARPALKSLPLGIKQKSILATCNYVARARGVRKLQLISEARKLCPDLVLADGEDLSAFRDASKRLYGLLRSFSWSNKVERLGLDEIFFDATDMVEYNVALLNRNALSESFFCLSRDDPEQGFRFDASALAGCSVGNAQGGDLANYDNMLYVKLVLASHLARYIRLKIEEDGYTSACGISTNKLLAKLVGSANKPRNQTTLLSLQGDDALTFMDSHGLRNVPGIGGKITHALESFFLGTDADSDTYTNGSAVTVGQFRARPGVSPQMLERLLGSRPGSERGIGDKVWGLLHGCDETEVKAASRVPAQISIEDTYPGSEGGLNTMAEIEREMVKLGASLLRRMHVDLTEDDDLGERPSFTATGTATATATANRTSAASADGRKRRRWLAHPKTLRLSTRPKTSYSDGKPHNWGRASRSQPLPTFVFGNSPEATNEATVAKLVKEALRPMFTAINPGGGGWNVGMINICVANMVPTAAAEPGAAGSGRDISQMFKVQDDVLREFRVYNDDCEKLETSREVAQRASSTSAVCCDEHAVETFTDVEMEPWDDLDGSRECDRCGHHIPPFAMAAHQRFHELGDV